ncbi:MAG: hypothetical protein GF364_06820 [Candidatus Lokiarchaeota archaeon]|nr:hypothetical protein [Candidatus Lokiarchaeota archaeon]
MNDLKPMRISGIVLSTIGVVLILFSGIKTVTNFRILSDIIQNILIFNIILLIFMPERKRLLKSFILGIIVMIYDFLIETIAVKFEWWFPLSGTQYPPFLVIPLEMVISFFIIGSSFSLLFDLPERIEEIKDHRFVSLKKLFSKKYSIHIFRVILVVLNAFVGMHGDYSAPDEIWMPGENWSPLFTFLIWLSGGLLSVAVFYFIEYLMPNQKEKPIFD